MLMIVWQSNLVNERDFIWMCALCLVIIAFVCTQQYNKHYILHYFRQDQMANLQEATRQRLKTEHLKEIRLLKGNLNSASDKVNRLSQDHDWMSGMYQDQMRLNQEQEDRIKYLERKLQEFGQHSPAHIMPFSAPSTTTTFANPPRRVRATSAADPTSS
jgi:hypothetical protein